MKFAEAESFQIIWGCIAAFKKDEKIDIFNLEVYPIVEGGHPTLFKDLDTKIQHPKAELELLAIDDGLTHIISKNENITKKLLDYYVNAKIVK